MDIRLENRVLRHGEKFVLQKNNTPTIRSFAEEQGWSKSTMHQDLTVRLKECDKSLYNEVQKILQKNKDERHIRGGEATRQKCLSLKK